MTGGAGLYGRQLTRAVAEAGAATVVAARNAEALRAVAVELARDGLEVGWETFDQADEASGIALRDRVLERHGAVHGLVNNAVSRPMGGLDDALEAWEASMRANAAGVFALTRAFGAAMCAQGCGSIVNVASIQGMVGPDPLLYEGTDMGLPPPDYFFHKGGTINLTRYFASVFGARGVRVNCVSPGGFLAGQPAPFVRRYSKRTMLGRMADERDLGGAVVFLLSEAARYVTGVNLPVDGGYTAR